LLVEFLPDFSEQVEQGEKQIMNAMQSSIEATFPQHVGNVAFYPKHMAGLLKVSAKAQGSHDGRGHDLGIRHLTLRVIAIVKSFQHIVTQTKDSYNLSVHRFTCNWYGLVTFPIYTKPMDFSTFSPKVATWVN
jgi:hypothetical protein